MRKSSPSEFGPRRSASSKRCMRHARCSMKKRDRRVSWEFGVGRIGFNLKLSEFLLYTARRMIHLTSHLPLFFFHFWYLCMNMYIRERSSTTVSTVSPSGRVDWAFNCVRNINEPHYNTISVRLGGTATVLEEWGVPPPSKKKKRRTEGKCGGPAGEIESEKFRYPHPLIGLIVPSPAGHMFSKLPLSLSLSDGARPGASTSEFR
jgi:hypothetical protein